MFLPNIRFYSGGTWPGLKSFCLASILADYNFGNNWTNGSTLSHCRSMPFAFWSYLPIIQGYTFVTSPTSIHWCRGLHRQTASPTGSAHWVVHGEPGCNRWKKIWVYPSLPVNSQPWTAHYGHRYDRQQVKQSNEWVHQYRPQTIWFMRYKMQA